MPSVILATYLEAPVRVPLWNQVPAKIPCMTCALIPYWHSSCSIWAICEIEIAMMIERVYFIFECLSIWGKGPSPRIAAVVLGGCASAYTLGAEHLLDLIWSSSSRMACQHPFGLTGLVFRLDAFLSLWVHLQRAVATLLRR